MPSEPTSQAEKGQPQSEASQAAKAPQHSRPSASSGKEEFTDEGESKHASRRVNTPSRRKKDPPSGKPPATTNRQPRQPPQLPSLDTANNQKTLSRSAHSASPAQVSDTFEENVGKPSREAFNSFFYPPNRPSPSQQQRKQPPRPPSSQQRQAEGEQSTAYQPGRDQRSKATSSAPANALATTAATTTTSPREEFDDHFRQQQADDVQFVQDFWQIYDDVLFLSLFTQLGVVARLGSSTWFTYFDGVFTSDSALFVNLPLNCLSCFILGMLCSGENCMEIISTRFSPPRLQQHYHKEHLDDLSDGEIEVGGDMDDFDMVEEHHSPIQSIYQRGPLTPTSSPKRGGVADSPPAIQPSESMDISVGAGTALSSSSLRQRRRTKHEKQHERKFFRSWNPPVHLNEELRDVQLLALERRIRQSKCLILFPVNKEDVDVMEHYFDEGYKKKRGDNAFREENGDQDDFKGEEDALFIRGGYDTHDLDEENAITSTGHDLQFDVSHDPTDVHHATFSRKTGRSKTQQSSLSSSKAQASKASDGGDPLRQTTKVNTESNHHDHNHDSAHVELHGEDNPKDLNQIVTEVSANVTENVSRLRRVNIANGWDVGTTAEDMSDDIMLGLRFGFCGALSSFSSWNSSMISLIRSGKIGEAVVGYMLGMQLPIIAYRFGQHVAVYVFVWRCREETKRDERRGYGIRLHTEDEDDDEKNEMNSVDHRSIEMSPLPADDGGGGHAPNVLASPNSTSSDAPQNKDPVERQSPSIRAIVTVLFIMAVVTQCTSISFYSSPQNQVVALSLLFSPLGVLARWQLSRYNSWRPTFPIGTFSCNLLACALSGGLGRLLAGNPNQEERLVLQSMINGFGGTLSSVANFIVEILAGVDPVLFRFDGAIYALWSIFWAMMIGFLFSASADWADATGGDS